MKSTNSNQIDRNEILFIVNPVAGKGKSVTIEKKINNILKGSSNYNIVYWEDKEQSVAGLIKNNTDNRTGVVAAVGGDGTFNAVASALVNSNIKVAHIPVGSGNGFARHLGIPMRTEKSLLMLKKKRSILCDAGIINGRYFFTTAGIGFDAHISYLFENHNKRGFWTYFKLTLSQFLRYKENTYEININGDQFTKKAFLITLANANQWGNNTIIAPEADISDGKLDVVIMEKPGLLQTITIIPKLFNNKIQRTSLVQTIKASELMIKCQDKFHTHYDGEYMGSHKELNIKILPGALHVIIP